MERDRLVPIAEIARPHGVLGELRLRVFHEGSDLLLSRPPVVLRLADGSARPAKIARVRAANKALLATLEGVSGRDAAEALKGALVCVPRASLPELEPGEFYACDVEGALLVDEEGRALGRVERLVSYPSCDALLVTLDASEASKAGAGGRAARRLEVPLVEAYVIEVDAAARRVRVRALEDLE